jgi:hypothetical protein
VHHCARSECHRLEPPDTVNSGVVDSGGVACNRPDKLGLSLLAGPPPVASPSGLLLLA